MDVGVFPIEFQVDHRFRRAPGAMSSFSKTRWENGRARNIMRSAFLSPKECSKWRITGCRQRKNWSAPTPAFHRARVWRRRRPRKTTLGKSRYRTISRVRVDELLLAGGLRLRFPLPESVNAVPS